MKRYNFILLVVILAACSPQKRLTRLLDNHPYLVSKDTVFKPGPVVYRDTTVFREVPGDTAYIESTIVEYEPWDDDGWWEDPIAPPLNVPPVWVSTELATAKAWVERNVLKALLIQKDSVFRFKLDSAIRMNQDTITVERLIKYQIPMDPPTFKFYRAGFWILGVLIILALIIAAYFAFRKR